MKRSLVISAVIIGLGAVAYYAAPFQPSPRPLASLAPGGALLILESPDFAGELRDWNTSPEKAAWLASQNFEEFSRGMLFLRLQREWESFQSAATFNGTMPVLSAMAGKRSALALYDIGKLEFLYITELPEADAMRTALGQSRAHYEPRSAGGFPFYVHRDDGHTIAFAAAGGYLFLATREEAIAGALELLSGAKSPAVASEPWYMETTASAGATGDLRMTLNLERTLATHQFKAHWLYGNQASLQQFWAGVADIHRDRGEIREDRVFLRRDAAAAPESVASIARLAPDDAGFYRVLPASASEAAAEIERKLLPKQGQERAWYQTAPAEPVSPEAGAESDLEIRIDEAPLILKDDAANEPLRAILAKTGVKAMMEAQTSEAAADGVFVALPFAIALESAQPWDEAAVREALRTLLASAWTVTGQREVDALDKVTIAARGNILVIGNSNALAQQVLARIGQSGPDARLTYIAEFRHAREQANFERMMSVLDQTNASGPFYRRDAHPFFSGNLVSFGRTLERVQSAYLQAADDGKEVRETVHYRLR